MIDRRSKTRRLLETELPALLIVTFAVAPYVWMVLTSLKPEADIAAFPVRYLPTQATLDHYRMLLARTSFAGNLLNSLIIAIGATLLGLTVSVPAAYAFSRFRFAGRRFLMTQFLVINMFPVVLIIIPLFVLMRQLGLIDTFLGIILGHSTFAIPFSVWMLTSYMNAIPPTSTRRRGSTVQAACRRSCWSSCPLSLPASSRQASTSSSRAGTNISSP